MVSRKQSTTSIVEDTNQRCRNTVFSEIQKQHKIMMVGEGLQLSLGDEEEGEYSLMKNETMSTASMDDSSCSSMSISLDMQSTIQSEGTDYISNNNVEDHWKYGQRNLSVSEKAAERLYSNAAKRNKRILMLGETLTYPIKMCHRSTSNAGDNVRMIHNKILNNKTSVKSTSDVYSSHSRTNAKKKYSLIKH